MPVYAEDFEGGVAGTDVTTSNTIATEVYSVAGSGTPQFVSSPVHAGALAMGCPATEAAALGFSHADLASGFTVSVWAYLEIHPLVTNLDGFFVSADFATTPGGTANSSGGWFRFDRAGDYVEFIYEDPVDGSNVNVTVGTGVTGEWRRYEMTLDAGDQISAAVYDASNTLIWSQPSMERFVHFGQVPCGATCNVLGTDYGMRISLDDLVFTAPGDDDFVPPTILRVYPRKDGLGLSSTPNLIGPGSQQRSNRIAGGTYY